MTKAKNSMTFHMIYGMKETCTKARSEEETRHTQYDLSQFKQNVMTKINLFLFSCWTYPYSCVYDQDLKEELNRAVLQEATL